MKRSMLVGCLIFAGCIAEDEVATTEQELGAWGSFVLDCGSGTWCETNIGTSIGRTCFLGGISGPIATHTSGSTGMGVFREGDYYVLRITNKVKHATVIAICISGASDRVEARWRMGDGPTIIPAGSPHRRCFLSNITTDAGFNASPQYPDATPPYVAINKHPGNGTWQLRGDLEVADSHGGATAVCVDVPELVATTFVTSSEGETGTKTGLLVDDTTAACGLTHIGGTFQYHVKLDDRFDQHFEGMQAFLSDRNDWRWKITNTKGRSKTAGFACVR
jgi:hypothetical protein